MSDERFISATDIELTEMSTASQGLLRTTRAAPYGEIIMTLSHGHRIAIYPRHDNPFLYIIAEDQRPDKPGVMFREPAIEVDYTSMFDSRQDDHLGDLIVSKDGISVVAQYPEGHEDSERIRLWGQLSNMPKVEVGFKRWRMTTTGPDGERQVIFTQPAAGDA